MKSSRLFVSKGKKGTSIKRHLLTGDDTTFTSTRLDWGATSASSSAATSSTIRFARPQLAGKRAPFP